MRLRSKWFFAIENPSRLNLQKISIELRQKIEKGEFAGEISPR